MHHGQCRFHFFCCYSIILLEPWPVLADNIIPEELDHFMIEIIGLHVMGIAIDLSMHHNDSMRTTMPTSSDL